MSCLPNIVHGSRMLEMAALVLSRLKQAKDWAFGCSTPVPQCPGRAPHSLCHWEGQPAALSLGAVDTVKILLDVLGKLCKTWIILDSTLLKYILSMRALFWFFLDPNTLLISSVYNFLTNTF